MDIKKRWGTILSAVLAVGILVLSIMPADMASESSAFYFPSMDKLIHGIMYFVFTLVVLAEYLRVFRFGISSLLWITSAILAYSVFMEFLQYFFISSRSGEVLDIVANLTGIVLATIIILILRKVRS